MAEDELQDEPRAPQGPVRRRLIWSVAVAASVVLVASVLVPTYGQSAREASGLLQKQHTASALAVQETAAGTEPHAGPAATMGAEMAVDLDGHSHSHDDSRTKNAISRTTGDSETAETKDPTTPVQAAIDTASVARQRSERGPRLVPLAKSPTRGAVSQTRYAMAGGCYALQAVRNSRWVRRDGTGFRASGNDRTRALPLHFQATDLGKYLLYGDRRDFVAQSTGTLGTTKQVMSAPAPSSSANWRVTRRGATYLFRLGTAGPGKQ